MTLKGIDISNWQDGIDLAKVDYDFAICKATEGLNFVDGTCDKFITAIRKRGKRFGFYHFAHPSNGAVNEANFFYANTKGYFGQGIPVLDWEAENQHDVAWAKTWLDTVYRLSGVKPMIYMSESVANAYDWSGVVKADYGLWVAKYRDYDVDRNYDMSNAGAAPSVKWWDAYAMWQWTDAGKLDGYSGLLDCDVFYGDGAAWDRYAGKETAVTKKTAADYGFKDGTYTTAVAKVGVRAQRKVASDLLCVMAKGTEVKLKDLKLNSVGNIWGEIASGDHKGRYVMARKANGTVRCKRK